MVASGSICWSPNNPGGSLLTPVQTSKPMGNIRAVEEQLSAAEVATRLGVSERQVWRWIRNGKLAPVRKLGRCITRIPASAVNRFLEKRTVST